MLRQHLASERFDFAEGDGLEPAGALETETEAADPAEEVEDHQGRARGGTRVRALRLLDRLAALNPVFSVSVGDHANPSQRFLNGRPLSFWVGGGAVPSCLALMRFAFAISFTSSLVLAR